MSILYMSIHIFTWYINTQRTYSRTLGPKHDLQFVQIRSVGNITQIWSRNIEGAPPILDYRGRYGGRTRLCIDRYVQSWAKVSGSTMYFKAAST